MKLSVIIPVYHVEATLDRCVASVLRQQVEEMEVILVDDGSPDRCPQMCDDWGMADSCVKVVHKANGGLSDARNAGLDIARGDYITFIDSDDWVEAGTYAALMDRIGDSDILEYGIADLLRLDDHTYTDIGEYWLSTRAYTHTYACNKIYRRHLFHHVRFPRGRIFEDVSTLPRLLREATTVATTSLGTYHYTWNPDGITAQADGPALAQLLQAHLQSGMPVDDRYYMYLLNIQMDVCERTSHPPVLPRRHVRLKGLTSALRVKAILQNLFGINILCRIFKTVHYIKKPARSSRSS